MILYNVTINIQESVHDQWLQWMQEKHIQEVLATGKFSSARMVKVLVVEDMVGITYAIQYTTDSKETLQRYYDEDAPRLREEGALHEGLREECGRSAFWTSSRHSRPWRRCS